MKILLLIVILLAAISCGSVRDGLTMQKRNNSDEFLIQKKNPLVLPPKYGNLPKPKESKDDENENSINSIQSLLDNGIKKNDNKKSISNVETIILKEIKSK